MSLWPADLALGRPVTTVLMLLLLLGTAEPSPQDDLCYLSNGGASETYTVNEMLPIGSLIGTLPIEGDPSREGDIELRFHPVDKTVAFVPHTKSLILTGTVDKEGVEGPSSVLAHVQCTPKHTEDLSITIPIRLVVMDANDNAPTFVGGPFFANVSEVSVVGTTVIQGIRATDRDQQGPYSTVEYSIEPGPYSQLLAIENPLEGTVTLNAPLDYEILSEFTVTLKAQDQGDPPQWTTTNLTVTVLDADDQNPRFTFDHYEALLPSSSSPGDVLEISPGPIYALDPDEGVQSPIEYSFNSDSPERGLFAISSTTAEVSLREGSSGLDGPVTLVVRGQQIDNPDRYALATLTITPQGVALRCLHPEGYAATVAESVPLGQSVLAVHTAPSKDIRFKILDHPSQTFKVHTNGEIAVAKQLDYELRQFYTFRVLATDGHKSVTCNVNITVLDVNDNDPEFAETQYTFLVSVKELFEGMLVGHVDVVDKDLHDVIELNLKGPLADAFQINEDGDLFLLDPRLLNTSTCHLLLTAVDSGQPPRRASVSVTIQFPLRQGIVQTASTADGILMIVFGVVLGTLLLVIVLLAIYIMKSKHYRERLPTLMRSNPALSSGKLHTGYVQNGNGSAMTAGSRPENGSLNGAVLPVANGHPPGVENPIFTGASAVEYAVVKKRTLDSNHRHRPSPPPPPTRPQANGSIPRRVKKLSWGYSSSRKTELDPDVSVAPLGKEGDGEDQGKGGGNELTVYF